jgi:phosphate-selective porin OprO and OprP
MRLALLFLLLTSFELITAQDFTDNKFGKGIRITAKDSSFSMKLGARFQTLYEGIYNEDSEEWSDKLLIRRARLKFEGFAYSPKLEYKIEIGLSNRDIGGATPETGNTPRIILDAVLKWHFKDNWQLWFGQTKLPGNRERVISSQKLQFVDRSLVNSRFNLDRDIGIQFHHKNRIGGGILKQIASVSMGEGRNITSDNIGGYDYTGRLEYLPFGEFKSQGDYFGSDLKREEKPKLAIGATYDFNQGASRQRGQLGGFNADAQGPVTNDLSTFFIDAMFKYNGLSIMSEYTLRDARKDIAGFEFGTGNGYVLQTGYLFRNNFEIAARYTIINADDLVFSSINEETEYAWGISKYFVEHSLKIQSDLSYGDRKNASNTIRYRFQVELSF